MSTSTTTSGRRKVRSPVRRGNDCEDPKEGRIADERYVRDVLSPGTCDDGSDTGDPDSGPGTSSGTPPGKQRRRESPGSLLRRSESCRSDRGQGSFLRTCIVDDRVPREPPFSGGPEPFVHPTN